jgi:hypothetical protein
MKGQERIREMVEGFADWWLWGPLLLSRRHANPLLFEMLYKHPQRAFPYEWFVTENRRRDQRQSEFELLKADAFDQNLYFDVFVEYAKSSPEDILMQITVWNRGPEAALLHVLPQLWYRNTWSLGYDLLKPELRVLSANSLIGCHTTLGEYHFYLDGNLSLLFCGNETNTTNSMKW